MSALSSSRHLASVLCTVYCTVQPAQATRRSHSPALGQWTWVSQGKLNIEQTVTQPVRCCVSEKTPQSMWALGVKWVTEVYSASDILVTSSWGWWACWTSRTCWGPPPLRSLISSMVSPERLTLLPSFAFSNGSDETLERCVTKRGEIICNSTVGNIPSLEFRACAENVSQSHLDSIDE